MSTSDGDNAFTGSIPDCYENYLVPLIFEPYALDLAKRVAALSPRRVLEIAAGTGVVTRQLATQLPQDTTIVATDLNQPMLELAARRGTARPVEWRQADAMDLPFADASFDVVLCQFGTMFFPSKAAAFAEARRVLRPGGVFIFNVWDRLDKNELAHTVTEILAATFPTAPPSFLERIPHGYHDARTIAADLAAGGFERPPAIASVAALSVACSPRIAAIAFCHGTPLRNEIGQQGKDSLSAATEAATAGIAQRFGVHAWSGKMNAHIVSIVR